MFGICPQKKKKKKASDSFTFKKISLVVHWLRLHASNAGGMGSSPGQGTNIPHASQHGQKLNKNKKWSPWCFLKFLMKFTAFIYLFFQGKENKGEGVLQNVAGIRELSNGALL